MKTQRFLIEQKDIIKDNVDNCLLELVNSNINHQLKNVLKIKRGQKIIFLDGEGNSIETIYSCMKGNCLLFEVVNEQSNLKKNNIKLTIYPALIKKDKIEYVFQKCTEIGVEDFKPIISERSEKLNLKLDRAKKIIKEAFEQSWKNYLPQISAPMLLEKLLNKYETPKSKLENLFYLDIEAPIIEVKQLVSQIKYNSENQKEIGFFVGPEGGWTELDKELFKKHNVKPISLGDTVLRAETASIAISSLILLGQK